MQSKWTKTLIDILLSALVLALWTSVIYWLAEHAEDVPAPVSLLLTMSLPAYGAMELAQRVSRGMASETDEDTDDAG